MLDINFLNFQYTYIYVAINLFCVFISLLLLSRFSIRVGNSREMNLFHAMNGIYIIYLVLEIIWVLALTKAIILSELATGLIKIIDTTLIPFVVYLWFWFAEERFHSKLMNYKWFKILVSLPIILMVIIYLTSFYTGLVFKITPELTVEYGPLFYLTGIIDNFYGASIIIHAIILYTKEKVDLKKDIIGHRYCLSQYVHLVAYLMQYIKQHQL